MIHLKLRNLKIFLITTNDLYELNKWESFENENQRIFSGMYQFWCQKLIKSI